MVRVIRNFWQAEKNNWKIPLAIIIIVIFAFIYRWETVKTSDDWKTKYDRWTTQTWLYRISDNQYFPKKPVRYGIPYNIIKSGEALTNAWLIRNIATYFAYGLVFISFIWLINIFFRKYSGRKEPPNKNTTSTAQIKQSFEDESDFKGEGNLLAETSLNESYKAEQVQKNLTIRWLNFYTNVRIPLGIILGLGNISKTNFVSVSLFLFLMGLTAYGLIKRQLWGWRINWALLILETFSLALRNAYISKGSFTISIILLFLVWFLPNFIYFSKRKYLFYQSEELKIKKSQLEINTAVGIGIIFLFVILLFTLASKFI